MAKDAWDRDQTTVGNGVENTSRRAGSRSDPTIAAMEAGIPGTRK